MYFFDKNPNINKMSSEFAEAITNYSVFGVNKFKETSIGVLEKTLTTEQIATGYLEFNMYLLHILDKLISKNYGDVFRSKFINKTIDKTKQIFCNMQEFDEIIDKKNEAFEAFFKHAFYYYSLQGSILDVTIELTQRLMRNIHSDVTPKSKYNNIGNFLSDALERYIVSILSSNPFLKLNKS